MLRATAQLKTYRRGTSTRLDRRRGTSVRSQGAPHDLIVLETDIRLTEQPFQDCHQLGLGQSVLAPGERPSSFRQHEIRDQDGLGGIKTVSFLLRYPHELLTAEKPA